MESYLDESSTLVRDVARFLELSEPNGATDRDIDAVALFFGVDYLGILEVWLAGCRGPFLVSQPIVGFGATKRPGDFFHYRDILESHPDWVDFGWVPIASDGCGNFYIYPLKTGDEHYRPIFLVYAESPTEPSQVVASNLLRFILRLLRSELTDFDESIEDDIDYVFSEEEIRANDPEAVGMEPPPVCPTQTFH